MAGQPLKIVMLFLFALSAARAAPVRYRPGRRNRPPADGIVRVRRHHRRARVRDPRPHDQRPPVAFSCWSRSPTSWSSPRTLMPYRPCRPGYGSWRGSPPCTSWSSWGSAHSDPVPLPTGSRPEPGLSILATAVVAVATSAGQGTDRRPGQPAGVRQAGRPVRGAQAFAGRMGGSYAADDVLPDVTGPHGHHRWPACGCGGRGRSGAVLWDYAAAGPYGCRWSPGPRRARVTTRTRSSCPPATKFPGGPQTPGVLVVHRKLVRNAVPTVPGGGTVAFVDPADHRYLERSRSRARSARGGRATGHHRVDPCRAGVRLKRGHRHRNLIDRPRGAAVAAGAGPL